MPNEPILKSEIDEVKRIAVSAGKILLDYYSTSTIVEWKSPGNPVTRADREANDYIVQELERLFPEDGILSEEMADTPRRLQLRRVWMVDPMDGTNEFISQRDEFVVMIGLAEKGRAIAGVVYQPTSRKLYHAYQGGGAFLEWDGMRSKLQVSSRKSSSQLTLAVSRSHRSSRVERIRDYLRIKRSVRCGSVGLKVGLICEGRADLYIHAGSRTHLWDTCAPEAILCEAGGRMTDTENAALRYAEAEVRNLYGIIASNSVVHERAVQAAHQILSEV